MLGQKSVFVQMSLKKISFGDFLTFSHLLLLVKLLEHKTKNSRIIMLSQVPRYLANDVTYPATKALHKALS
jgi:hypothetical protein